MLPIPAPSAMGARRGAAHRVTCPLAVWREGLRHAALACILFLTSGLALARLSGVALDGELSSYTTMGLGFEFVSAGFAGFLLSRRRSGAVVRA